MDYNFREIEKKWQSYWRENRTYEVAVDPSRPKYYVLDMFPYPSGAGLHVGHPLGYIASDIYTRYKRLQGYNVLHPMGYDAFGLPAEQYAIQTGQHPAVTTDNNIRRYREQLEVIGFSYDWTREFRTCDPSYYKWTQWVFVKLFGSWYNKSTQKAEPIETLIAEFEQHGNLEVDAACSPVVKFSAPVWRGLEENERQDILANYRLAYLGETMVNWCEELKTVLANDEVKDGLSVRGGFPVAQKKMKQWSLRISAYAERLLQGLDTIEWSESIKEIQRNWIGRSEGAEVLFDVADSPLKLEIFTTRPDTIFGVTFMVLAPESEYVAKITPKEYRDAVNQYLEETKKKTERERIADVKTVSGVFTGAYCVNPFTLERIPIWVSDYVLAGYGTGAIMAVPAHDTRDYAFAKHFNLPIVAVIEGDISEAAVDAKEGKMINSGFLTGTEVKDAIKIAISVIEEHKLGRSKVNYRLRDAIFSRQRYWGEPFPVYYKDGMAHALPESELPLVLPDIDSFRPTETGEPPLARAKNWETTEGYKLELSTMPGFAGSSAYYLRYMDPHNNEALVSREAVDYWQDVDLYIGGMEHATGHLVYSRFWNKFLFDLGCVAKEEPFKKLINQGMIQGRSNFVYRVKGTNTYVSLGLRSQYDTTEIHVDVNIVKNDILDLEKFRNWNEENKNAEFVLENGEYRCGWAVEKMSKSMYNVVNPDMIVNEYGADTLRLYEMFLGPLEQAKPWDTNGIEGVHKFLRKLWRLYHDTQNQPNISDEEPTRAEMKVLHRTIKKIADDIEKFSFNTSVSAFMICVNELGELKCNKRAVLEPLTILIASFAPHIAEELWSILGYTTTICDASFPVFNSEFLVENTVNYPVSFNGKVRFQLSMPTAASKEEVEQAALAHEESAKWMEGKTPKKVIVVVGKIVNVVL